MTWILSLHLPLGALTATLAAGPVAAAEVFSHDDWTAVLERFVDERGRVDYHGLAGDREIFDRYLAAIATTGPKTRPELFPTRDHELAYYLNAYNALVFAGVLDRGPEEKSVWSGGLISGYAFFVARKLTLDGETTSLKKLEDDTIRAGYEDPRIHAALNCASISCPRLPRKAFDPAHLDAELDAAMRELVAEERNVAVDHAGKRVSLAKIFDWFADDFLEHERKHGEARPSLIDYINRYRGAETRIPRDYRIDFFKYDKRINRQ